MIQEEMQRAAATMQVALPQAPGDTKP
jgi:hypothetical protein